MIGKVVAMLKEKFLSVAIALVILGFSFLGLIQVPVNVNKSFSLIKAVMPYPGKTVFAINKFIKSSSDPLQEQAHSNSSRQDEKEDCNRLSGILFYLLSSIVVCNEKSFLLLLIIFAAMSAGGIVVALKSMNREVYIPPEIYYYRRWRLKFITPTEKCIQVLAEKYDINPIFRAVGSVCPGTKPALCL
jgi:hypothetical protein